MTFLLFKKLSFLALASLAQSSERELYDSNGEPKVSRDGEDYLSLCDDHTDSTKGYLNEDDLDSDLDEMLAKIYDDGCDSDENCEMENLFTRTSCCRTAGT